MTNMNKIHLPNMLQSDWRSYLCRVNDKPASVFVDLGLERVQPLAQAPKLAWLWIRLNHPGPDGMSSDAEFKALCQFEDELEASIRQLVGSCYPGRITTEGRREFYFYVPDDAEFGTVVDELMDAHREFAFQFGEKADPTWSHYRNLLLPGPQGIKQIEAQRLEELRSISDK
jgi:hypothetical protein